MASHIISLKYLSHFSKSLFIHRKIRYSESSFICLRTFKLNWSIAPSNLINVITAEYTSCPFFDHLAIIRVDVRCVQNAYFAQSTIFSSHFTFKLKFQSPLGWNPCITRLTLLTFHLHVPLIIYYFSYVAFQ